MRCKREEQSELESGRGGEASCGEEEPGTYYGVFTMYRDVSAIIITQDLLLAKVIIEYIYIFFLLTFRTTDSKNRLQKHSSHYYRQ